MRRTVAVIFGGEGLEHDISIKSAERILHSMSRELYTPLPIYISKNGSWHICYADPLTPSGVCDALLCPTYPVNLDGECGFYLFGKIVPVDLAVIALHGEHGEDGEIQGALKTARIKTLGQSVLAGAATNDKALCKAVADSLNIPTAKWILLTESNAEEARRLAEGAISYPMFLKSTSFGSSHGAYPVPSQESFSPAYERIRELGECRILCEEYIRAELELECGFIDCGEVHYIANGVIHSSGDFYSFERKYSASNTFKAEIASLPQEVRERAEEYARQLVRALGIRFISRVDFFVKDDCVLFNEINSFPGLTNSSLYPQMLENKIAPFGECVDRLIAYAIAQP